MEGDGWNSIIYGLPFQEYHLSYGIYGWCKPVSKHDYITLPGIKSTFVTDDHEPGFILNAGLSAIFACNGIVSMFLETIDIFVLKYGIASNNFSFATAAGMFKSVVSIIMITAAIAAGKSAKKTILRRCLNWQKQGY